MCECTQESGDTCMCVGGCVGGVVVTGGKVLRLKEISWGMWRKMFSKWEMRVNVQEREFEKKTWVRQRDKCDWTLIKHGNVDVWTCKHSYFLLMLNKVIMVDGMKRTNLQTLCVCLIWYELHITCNHLEIFFPCSGISHIIFSCEHKCSTRIHNHTLGIYLKMHTLPWNSTHVHANIGM